MIQNDWHGLADGTYRSKSNLLITPPRPYASLSLEERVLYRFLAKRHVLIENLFARLKGFQCLKSTWRHSLFLHHCVFRVCLNAITINLKWHPLQRHNIIINDQIPQFKGKKGELTLLMSSLYLAL